MGQRANSGRNASLDDKKERAAGRRKQDSPEAERMQDAFSENFAKGKTGGAHGKEEATAGGEKRSTTGNKVADVGR